MNHFTANSSYLQKLLVVSQHQFKPTVGSPIIDSFDLVYLSVSEAENIVSWVQQYQPDLIILDLEWSQIADMQLTATLRLDWLTRNIPIVVLANPKSHQRSSLTELDYDICLNKPCSDAKLERAICTLVANPACKSCSIAV